jgi:hypothetical protein
MKTDRSESGLAHRASVLQHVLMTMDLWQRTLSTHDTGSNACRLARRSCVAASTGWA